LSLFDRKTSDKLINGYNAEEIRSWLSDVRQIDDFKYYSYRPDEKYTSERKKLKNQPTQEVSSFLDAHFTESPSFSVQIQQRIFKSGKWEIILRGFSSIGEITKLAVLNFKKISRDS